MAWPFSPTSQQNSLCFTRLDRGRKETEVLFTEQSSMTIPYGNVCLLVCLSFSLSVCLKPWLLIHQRFFPTCFALACFTRLWSSFFSSISFYQLTLFHPPSLPSQAESIVWKMSWLHCSKEHTENFFFFFKNQRTLIKILLPTNTRQLTSFIYPDK